MVVVVAVVAVAREERKEGMLVLYMFPPLFPSLPPPTPTSITSGFVGVQTYTAIPPPPPSQPLPPIFLP
jgi:hypothetical protein